MKQEVVGSSTAGLNITMASGRGAAVTIASDLIVTSTTCISFGTVKNWVLVEAVNCTAKASVSTVAATTAVGSLAAGDVEARNWRFAGSCFLACSNTKEAILP